MSTRTLHGMTMHSAALQLGISRAKLFALLKGKGLFNADNTPRIDLVRAGLFTVRVRQFDNPVSGISRQYATTLVTGNGLSWLHALVNDEPRPIQTPRCPDTADADPGRDETRDRTRARQVA